MNVLEGIHTFGDVLRANASAWPNKVAFQTPKGKSVTFADFNQRVNALNNAVAGLGVGEEARVAVLAKNCPEYLEAYGLCKSGLIVVPLNWRLAASELLKLIRHSAPEVLIVDAQHRQVVESIRDQVPCVRHFVLLEDGDPGWIGYEQLLATAATTEPMTPAKPEDILCLIYTSGTTGAPKGVAMTHAGAIGNCAAAARELELTDRDITMAVMPLFHAGGM